MAAICIFLTLVTEYGFLCHGCDIETTFLHALLTEECCMEIPLGYVRKQGEVENCVRLKNALYEVKPILREWNKTLVEFVT